jgi:hypothetical protein
LVQKLQQKKPKTIVSEINEKLPQISKCTLTFLELKACAVTLEQVTVLAPLQLALDLKPLLTINLRF